MLNTICHYILQWVEDNLDTGKNINDLVQTIGYSRKTVEMWFYKRYGITIGGYLFKRRMSRASVLLKLTHMSITEIATLLHYSSSQNFARTFKNSAKNHQRNIAIVNTGTSQQCILRFFIILTLNIQEK